MDFFLLFSFCFTCFFYITYNNHQVNQVCMAEFKCHLSLLFFFFFFFLSAAKVCLAQSVHNGTAHYGTVPCCTALDRIGIHTEDLKMAVLVCKCHVVNSIQCGFSCHLIWHLHRYQIRNTLHMVYVNPSFGKDPWTNLFWWQYTESPVPLVESFAATFGSAANWIQFPIPQLVVHAVYH